jgi:hypothetical protein
LETLINKQNLKKEFLIKGVVLLVISFLCLYRVNHLLSFPTGDGVEYILVTEAFYKHKSPDIRATDSWSFKRSFTKVLPWDSVYKPHVFNAFEAFIVSPNKKFGEPGDSYGGLYVAKNGKIYGYHFFTYSLLNVPARYFLGLLHKNPLSAFKITNAVFVIITCLILLFFTPFNSFLSSLIAISFYFSSVYWYLDWAHSELFTTCLVTISLWLFFQNKFYIPLLLMAIATTQNQPLMLMLVYMVIVTLFTKGLSYNTIIKIGLCSILSILPPLFYYYNFDTFSIIKKAGFLDAQYQTPTRMLGFYFDINQGIILAIPIALLLYIALWFKKTYSTIRSKKIPSSDLFLVLVLVAITFTVSTMGNWNHGQSVINRYATWVSAIILVHVFFLLNDLKLVTKTILISLITLSQIFTAIYHSSFNNNEVSWYQHKPIARWVLSNYPSLYNPDSAIFGIRTSHDFMILPRISPIIFFNDKKELCKIMCHVDKMEELSIFGISQNSIDKFRKEKKVINGWIYINKGEFTSDLSKEKIYYLATYLKAKKMVIPKIKENPGWYAHVKDNAKTMNISVDSSLVIDALYVLDLEEKNKN